MHVSLSWLEQDLRDWGEEAMGALPFLLKHFKRLLLWSSERCAALFHVHELMFVRLLFGGLFPTLCTLLVAAAAAVIITVGMMPKAKITGNF